jgi:hypothetical protein
MNRDDIIRMAREAADATGTLIPAEWNEPLLECFATLVAAHERQPLTATAIGNHLRRKDSGEFSLYRNGFKDGVRWAERKHKIGVVNDPQ